MSLPIRTINRGVVIIRPKQPFLNWLSSVEKQLGQQPFSIDLTEEGNAFLIPDEDITDSKDAQRYIERRWKEIFEQFLYEWIIEDSLWPKKRTLKMFREWFEMIYAPMTWDFANQPLEIEEFVLDEFVPPPHLH
jgi:hypothetical protein